MPSAHAAMYAALGTSLAAQGVPRWVAYPLAGAGYLSLAPQHNHWISDMVLGGAMGAAVATRVHRTLEERRARPKKIRLNGSAATDSAGLETVERGSMSELLPSRKAYRPTLHSDIGPSESRFFLQWRW